MDVEEVWGYRVQSFKHSARLNSSEMHLALDDSEDDDLRACVSCPFCYVDIEVPVLCSHLQEEHCFNMKNAVCPVCAANLERDMIGHFTVQHSHLMKRRKSQRAGLWIDSSTMLGKDLRELISFLGVASTNSKENAPDSAPDPLLSPIICSISLPDTKGEVESNCGSEARVASASLDVKSVESSTSDESEEQDNEEKSQRAEFAQQLLLSTIF